MNAVGVPSFVAVALLLLILFVVVISVVAVGIFFLLRSRKAKTTAHKADHFAFQVSDLKRAVDFYTGSLGLKLVSTQIDEERHEAFAFVELDGGNLELLQTLDEENHPLPVEKKPVAPPYCPHLAIQTNDMDKLLQHLREENLPIIKGPLEIPGSVKWVYLCDPDNNVIEFVQWMKKQS